MGRRDACGEFAGPHSGWKEALPGSTGKPDQAAATKSCGNMWQYVAMALVQKSLNVQRVGFKSDFHSPPDNLPLLDVILLILKPEPLASGRKSVAPHLKADLRRLANGIHHDWGA